MINIPVIARCDDVIAGWWTIVLFNVIYTLGWRLEEAWLEVISDPSLFPLLFFSPIELESASEPVLLYYFTRL